MTLQVKVLLCLNILLAEGRLVIAKVSIRKVEIGEVQKEERAQSSYKEGTLGP